MKITPTLLCLFATISTVANLEASARLAQQKTYSATTTRKAPKADTQVTQNQEEQPKTSVSEDDVEVAIVLSNFAQIVSHFITIVKDPKTTSTVAQGVGGIICNIGNIIAQAIRNGVIEFDSEDESMDYRSLLSKELVELQKEIAQRKKDCGCGCNNCGK